MPKPRPSKPEFLFLERLGKTGFKRIVGLDEVGRGSLAGPLVVAAVELEREIAGLDDSKRLSPNRRASLAAEVHRQARQIRFGQVSNQEIDELGLARAQRLAYQRSLELVEADLILTDNYHLSIGGRCLCAVRGDRLFYPVAAASIVAKVYRDQLMRVYHQFFPCYGWGRNAGYLTAEHKQALGHCGPSPLHRLSFAGVGYDKAPDPRGSG